MANCHQLVLCLHSKAGRFEDVYLTFAGADCMDPDFEAMLRWLQAKISGCRGAKVSVGTGGSKVVAAIASRVVPPGGECLVLPGTDQAFLAPVSVQKLRGVVAIDWRALAELGITTLGKLRQIPKPVLVQVFGEAPGRALWQAARGQDTTKSGQWKFGSLLSRGTAEITVSRQPRWMHRLSGLVRTKLEALDRVLERVLALPEEEVPTRTTWLS
jgi:nucleotidyltransferase/DNA polymerase involved in DNA repair